MYFKNLKQKKIKSNLNLSNRKTQIKVTIDTKKEFDGLVEPLGSASSNMVGRGWVEGGRWSRL